MIRLLLVEDETVTRKGLLNHIDWNELGVSLVEEATCGEEAMAKIQTFLPDIVITDIKMPNMDGIELSNIIKDHIPNCKIIYISGYSDKEYLKSAIKLQIIDYIEKPINIIELSSAIKKAVNLCMVDRKHLQDVGELKRQNKNIMMNKLIHECIKGNVDKEYYAKMLLQYNLSVKVESMWVCVIKLHSNNVNELKDAYPLSEIQEEMMENFFSQYTNIYGRLNNKEWVGILYSLPIHKCHFADLFENNFDKILNGRFKSYVCIGMCVNDVGDLYKSYDDACKQLRPKMFFETKFLNLNRNIKKNENIDEAIKLISSEAMNCEGAIFAYNLIEKYILDIIQCEMAVDEILNYIYKMMLNIYDTANRIGIGIDNITREKRVFEIISLEDVTLSMILDFIRLEVNVIFDKKESLLSNDKMILQIIHYIEKNYSDVSLTEQKIADCLYISASYLSKLFKQKTRKNISNYISEIRMERAKELLQKPCYKLYEIASLVGYNDGNYFTKIFKKYVGVTPTEYRKGSCK